MKLAIKKPKAVFWKTDLRVEDIQKMLQAEKITEEWLVCPQGQAGDAVLISEFLANPSIFKSYSHEQKDEAKTKPKKNDLKKRIIIAVLKGYAIGAVTGAIFVSLVTGVIGVRAFFAALILAPLTLFYFGDVLEILGFILLGASCDHSVRRPSRQRSSYWSPATYCHWKFCIGSFVGLPGRINGRLRRICVLEKESNKVLNSSLLLE